MKNTKLQSSTAAAGQNSGKIIENGDFVLECGYEFLVTNLDGGTHLTGHGQRVWYFDGVCTDDKRNDSIRRTCYNGGRYSWRMGENLRKGARVVG